MFCPNCGKEQAEGTKFCSNCGATLQATPDTSQVPTPQPPVDAQVPAQPKSKRAWYKKWWIWVLMGVGTIIFLSIIGNIGNRNTSPAPVSQIVLETTAKETDAVKEKAAETVVVTEKPTDAPIEKATEAPVENTAIVLYDANGIKITYKGITSGWMGTDVNLLIENNTDTDYCIQVRNMSVNGFMVDPTFSPDVAAGKKANDAISFYSSQLEENNIDKIEQLEFYFHIFSWDDMMDSAIETDTIVLNVN